MEPTAALRDKARNTQLLILAMLHARPGTTLSEIAGRLGITVQAISAHAKTMATQGLLRATDGSYRIESPGMQTLHEGVRGLHAAIRTLGNQLDVIHTTSAIAAHPIEAGQEVVLYMHEGELAAKPGTDGASRGIAQSQAEPGQEVVIGNLQGMVDLEPGAIIIMSLPGPDEGGTRRVNVAAAKQAADAAGPFDRIGALGTGATVIARQLGPIHLEFASDEAAFNAAERGLRVLLWATRDRLVEALQTCEHRNARTLRRIPVEVREAPLVAA